MYMGQEAPLRVGKFRVIFWGACAQPPVAPASMMASVASLVLARLVLEIMSACSFRPDPCRNYIVMLRVNRIFLHAGKPPGFSSSHLGVPAKIALRIKMLAVHLEDRTVTVVRRAMPRLPRGFARIRLIAAGICSTDLALLRVSQ